MLEDAYNTHWQNKVLLHPDIERAKRLLAQGEFPDYEDICREILLVKYPAEVPHATAEDFDELSWNYILDDVFTSNTAKGIQMWRSLLDIAEPSLKTNAKTAEKLLLDWDWLESSTDDQALPLLIALDDKRFVSQLFESAHIGRLQLDVLNACRSCGQEELGQHCLELALKIHVLKKTGKSGSDEYLPQPRLLEGQSCNLIQPSPLQTRSLMTAQCITIALFRCRERAVRIRI